MTLNSLLQLTLFVLLVAAITRPLGAYLFRVFEGAAQPLRAAGLDRVRVCLHAARADAHDWLVSRPGAARLAVRAVGRLTALGIAAGCDIVRVHDVRENLRTARMTDAIVRHGAHT